MLSVTHLEVGTLASFLRLALTRNTVWPIPFDNYRNGAIGQHWIQSAHRWRLGDKVIDVGCGYSDLPQNLVTAGCEVWGADDFGLKSGDTFWLRGKHPHDFVKQYPAVRYVFERLGESSSSFPEDYFDVVISNQALHIAKPPHAPIWRDMLRVMRKAPGCEMLVSMICNFGSDGNPGQAIQRLEEIRLMEHDIIGRLVEGEQVTVSEFDAMQQKAGQSFHRFSPALYVAYVATTLGVKPYAIPAELLAENYCTQVNALLDPVTVGFNNARFSNNPEEARRFRYGRYAPVLMRITWANDNGQWQSAHHGMPEFDKWENYNANLIPARHVSGYSIRPLGTPCHVLLAENSENATHALNCDLDLPANKTLFFSIFAKPAGRNFLGLWLRGPAGCDDMVEVFFDLAEGRVTTQTCYGEGGIRVAAIEPVSAGWMHCTILCRPSLVDGKARASILLRCDAEGSSRYSGDDRSGVYISLPNIYLERD